MTIVFLPNAEQARQLAAGNLGEARTHLIMAERCLGAAGPQLIPAGVIPQVKAALELVERLGLVVDGLAQAKQQ